MVDYIKLRQLAIQVNRETKCGPVPARWDDAIRPPSVGRPKWCEEINAEGK
jgi:hypothetical protein